MTSYPLKSYYAYNKREKYIGLLASQLIAKSVLSLVFQLQSECVIPIFDSAESQESDSDIDSRDGTRHCALGPILRPEILTLLSVVQSESVTPNLESTEPQEFNSDIDLRNRTRQHVDVNSSSSV